MKAVHATSSAATIDDGWSLDKAAEAPASRTTAALSRARSKTQPAPLDERNAIGPEAEAEFSLLHLAQGTETNFPIANEPWFGELKAIARAKFERAPTVQQQPESGFTSIEDAFFAEGDEFSAEAMSASAELTQTGDERATRRWWRRVRKVLGASSLD